MTAGESKTWINPEAEAALARWQERNKRAWEIEGADPDEVREDLEIHLQAKANALGRPLDATDLETALGELSMPAFEALPERGPVETIRKKTSSRPRRFTGFFTHPFFLGWWPLLVILVEAITGIFGAIIFDPISRWPQLLLLLGVAGLAWSSQRQSTRRLPHRWLQLLLGAGLVPAIYWGILSAIVIVLAGFLYLWGIFMSLGIALILFPIVLVCMMIAAAPIFAAIGLWRATQEHFQKGPWLAGIGLGLLLLTMVEGPAYVTRYGLATDNPRLVRSLGSKTLLRELALQPTWGPSREDTSGLLTNAGDWLDSFIGNSRPVEDVLSRRRFYYRVTGESPNRKANWSFLSSRQNSRWIGGFDGGQGGDEVGGFVRKLEMSDSRLDGHIDAASGLGYWEWTMEFHNGENRQKEARMQLLLPPGGVVSRLTLWIDGEPEEAAFGARSQVAAAYKSVVQRKRDPVLARWIGADRVLVQCFPVPENGKMKIRVGVTSPLDPQGRLYLPRLTEQNYSFADSLETGIWVQGDVDMTMAGLEQSGETGRWRETHGRLSLDTLTSHHTFVQCHDLSQPDLVWTEDRFAEDDESILIRERLPDHESPDRPVIFVVDGSKHFEPWAEAFVQALDDLKERGLQVEVIYAAEEGVFQNEHALNFEGGQDNLPALLKGLEVASAIKADDLIWLHGPQPVPLENTDRLVQLLERSFHKVTISTVDLAGGPNRLLEQLRTSVSVSSAGRPSGPSDLTKTLGQIINGKIQGFQYRRTAKGAQPEGTKVWDHLARWKVWEEVRETASQGPVPGDLAKKAAKYQLVTPVTGAVVLERAEQYDRFGLEQVGEETTPSIPGIPEPSAVLLLLIASGMTWRRRRAGTHF